MIHPEEVFPVFRCTPDRKHYYRIESLERFTEVQVIGRRAVLHVVHAAQYPERVRIMDMLEGGQGRYQQLMPEEWITLLRSHELG